MNPFEVERLGWDRSAACRSSPTPRSAPVASGSSAPAISTATGLEEVEAVGQELETAIPFNN